MEDDAGRTAANERARVAQKASEFTLYAYQDGEVELSHPCGFDLDVTSTTNLGELLKLAMDHQCDRS